MARWLGAVRGSGADEGLLHRRDGFRRRSHRAGTACGRPRDSAPGPRSGSGAQLVRRSDGTSTASSPSTSVTRLPSSRRWPGATPSSTPPRRSHSTRGGRGRCMTPTSARPRRCSAQHARLASAICCTCPASSRCFTQGPHVSTSRHRSPTFPRRTRVQSATAKRMFAGYSSRAFRCKSPIRLPSSGRTIPS